MTTQLKKPARSAACAAKRGEKQAARRRRRQVMARSWQLYAILLVPLVWLIVFKYVPMLGLQIAFRRYSPAGGIWHSKFVGLTYFARFFHSPRFVGILWNTLAVSVYQLVAAFPIPIVLALLLNSCTRKRFAKVVQTATYLPHFISTVVLVGMMMQFLNPHIGVYGQLAAKLGLESVDLLSKPEAFRHLYVWSGIWQNAGWGTVIYLANLAGVDPALHEAAQVDGANRFQRILHIDFPAILPTAIILLIMDAGKIMSLGFEKAFLMQNPLNGATSEIISTYVYKMGMTAGGDYSYSTAIGLFNSVINIILIVAVNRIARRTSETSLW